MIPVGVRDQNESNRPPCLPGPIEDPRDVDRVIGPRVDHDGPRAAEKVGVGALEGKR